MELKKFRDPKLDVSGERVGFYPREFYPFDNFSAFSIEWRGRTWPTAEHAYNAAKFFDTAPEIVEAIFNASSAHDARKIAKASELLEPDDWHEKKIPTMYEICLTKLAQHSYVRKKLLETGDLEIVEDSTKDAFWGWGPNKDGRNELGKIWMQLRDILHEARSIYL